MRLINQDLRLFPRWVKSVSVVYDGDPSGSFG